MTWESLKSVRGYGECGTCIEAFSVGIVGKVGCQSFETIQNKTDREFCYHPNPGALADCAPLDENGDDE